MGKKAKPEKTIAKRRWAISDLTLNHLLLSHLACGVHTALLFGGSGMNAATVKPPD